MAIQASKISTFLHQRTKPGVLPMEDKKVFQSPCAAFFSSCPHAKIARILFFVAAPAQIIYFYIIILIKGQSASIIFSTIYLSAALFQVYNSLRFNFQVHQFNCVSIFRSFSFFTLQGFWYSGYGRKKQIQMIRPFLF